MRWGYPGIRDVKYHIELIDENDENSGVQLCSEDGMNKILINRDLYNEIIEEDSTLK